MHCSCPGPSAMPGSAWNWPRMRACKRPGDCRTPRRIPCASATDARSQDWRWLRSLRHYASAAMDVSDGLVKDLERMMRASGVAGHLVAADVPLSDPARKVLARAPERLSRLITAGDDYEILLAVPKDRASAFAAAAAAAGVPVTRIGQVLPGPPALTVEGPGRQAAGAAGTHRLGPFLMRHCVMLARIATPSDIWHGPAANPALGCGLKRDWCGVPAGAQLCLRRMTAEKGERPWIR